MKILSLFDGISCGQLAASQLWKDYEYLASEIDKYSIKVTSNNFPETKHLGNVVNVRDIHDIDILIGGSPCQGFSNAGKKLNFDDERSQLFFEYVRILNQVKPRYFLLENVMMKKEYRDIISDHMGVDPVMINSSDFTAQDRKRLYWTNIPILTYVKNELYLSNVWDGGIDITDRYNKKVIGTLAYEKSRRNVRTLNQKSKTLTANGQNISNSGATNVLVNDRYFKLTTLCCERLQGIPDGYTKGISDTQRYKSLGNGFTVPVIKHILRGAVHKGNC